MFLRVAFVLSVVISITYVFLPDLAPRVQRALSKIGQPHASTDLDTWREAEQDVALERLLANVAPTGRNAVAATPGTVIASPSTERPDYYYQCLFALSRKQTMTSLTGCSCRGP